MTTQEIDNYREQPKLECCYNCDNHSYDCDRDMYCTTKRRPHKDGGTTRWYVSPTDVCDKFQNGVGW
jgi:hypothetical protein